MKKKLLLPISAILLTLALTSCGNTAETTTQPETETTTEETSTTELEVKELGEFNYKLSSGSEDIVTFTDPETGLVGYMDYDGNILSEPQYFHVGYSDGMLLLTDSETLQETFQSLDGSTSFDTVDGKKIAGANYFINGYTTVRLVDVNAGESVENDYDTLIDKQGNVVLETNIPNTHLNCAENGDIVLYDENGKVLTAYKPDLTEMTPEELASNENYDNDDIIQIGELYVQKADGGPYTNLYNNETGESASDTTLLATVQQVGDNYVYVSDNDPNFTYTVVDKYANELAVLDCNLDPLERDLVLTIVDDKIILLNDEFKARVFDSNGNLIKETNYDNIYQIDNYPDLIYCKVGDKIGVLDKDFNEVIPPEYDSISYVSDNKVLAVKDNTLYQFTLPQ